MASTPLSLQGGPDEQRGQVLHLAASKAARSGLLKDLEEAALLVEYVSLDRVSDICTNVIRRPLIDYTKAQADMHGVPTEQVRSGALWDPGSNSWGPEQYVRLPVGPHGPLLLVPKTSPASA